MKCGLLGERLGHSFSPQIHSELSVESLGFSGKAYGYELYEKKPDELEEFLKNGDFYGLNVTIPYKQAVIPFCAELSDAAREIGSVNTLTRRADGTLRGDNTDFYGVLYLLKKAGVIPANGKTLVLGSGGSSLTVCAALRKLGAAEIVVVSRNGENNYQNLERHTDAAYIINTTPVGMYPGNGISPLCDFRAFRGLTAVIDLIYNPAKTELMLQSEAHGVPAYGGLCMLVAQAKQASELWTNTVIPDETIERITAKIKRRTLNIVLIGMPGCGKSSIGAALAEITGRTFVDSDGLVEEKAGKTIPEIFAQNGEAAFRELEHNALRELCKQSVLIIATGGGVVTQQINRNVIRQNSVVVFLNRPVKDLPLEGRPLSLQNNIETMAAQRLPLYKQWADITVPVTGVEQTAKAVVNRWN